jgi:hypothetical protein
MFVQNRIQKIRWDGTLKRLEDIWKFWECWKCRRQTVWRVPNPPELYSPAFPLAGGSPCATLVVASATERR